MPKPPSPIVLVTSNSPSRVPASRVSAWFGPPVVTDGGAVVGMRGRRPMLGADVIGIVCVGGEAARGGGRRCRNLPGSRSAGRANDGAVVVLGVHAAIPAMAPRNCVPPAWGRPAWYRTRLRASRCIALKSARGRGLSAIPHPGREPARTRPSPKPSPRSPTLRNPYLQCAGPFHSSSSSRCRFTLRSSRPTTSAASSTRRSTSNSREHLGRAFGSEALAAGERAVAVGRDGRHSGPGLAAALIRGLVSTGIDVVDLGPVTTPMLYYVAATRGGARLQQRRPGHRQPQPEGLQRLQDGARRPGDLRRGHPAPAPADRGRGLRRGPGSSGRDGHPRRIHARGSSATARLKRPMRIVVDCGSGIAGASAPRRAARPRLQRRGAVFGSRRRLPASPSRPEQAGEPRRPDRRGRRRRRRARPRLRRRRRPARRRHQGRQDHLSRPAADAVRARRAAAQPAARRSCSTSSARSSWRR